MTTITKINWIVATTAAASLIATLYPTYIHAQTVSPCKGLEQQACTALQVFKDVPACTWVNGYTKADGTTRKGYCRGSMKKIPDGAVAINNKK